MADTAVVRRPRAPAVHDEALNTAKEALNVSKATAQKVDQILTLLGQEEEDGCGGFIATGLLGRFRRVEAQTKGLIKNYEGWFKFFAGFGVAFTLLAGLVTFLVSNGIITLS